MATQARCKKCKIYYNLEGIAQGVSLKLKILKCVVCKRPISATTRLCKDTDRRTILSY
jgi:hypothetical protein